jgi:hypothetical protein
MGMATVEIGPRTKDADHRLLLEILAAETHLLRAIGLVVARLAHGPEPALAAQVRQFNFLAHVLAIMP